MKLLKVGSIAHKNKSMNAAKTNCTIEQTLILIFLFLWFVCLSHLLSLLVSFSNIYTLNTTILYVSLFNFKFFELFPAILLNEFTYIHHIQTYGQ